MVEENNIKFQQHINRVLGLVVLTKPYLSCMSSDKDTLYMKIVAIDEIYEFLDLSFVI